MLGNGERYYLKKESDSLPSAGHFDSLIGGTKNPSFDQNTLLVDWLTNQSLENISINEVVPEHMGIEIASMSNAKIDIRDTFWELYSETFYSL